MVSVGGLDGWIAVWVGYRGLWKTRGSGGQEGLEGEKVRGLEGRGRREMGGGAALHCARSALRLSPDPGPGHEAPKSSRRSSL